MSRLIVVGCPCAGKSSFVREKSEPGDLVYDYDTLHSALSGMGSHQHLDQIRPFVLAARDAVFHQLESHLDQSAFIISSSPSAAEIKELSDRLSADVVYLDVNRAEAHRRADLDLRPAEWHQYIDNWFESSDLGSEDWSVVMKRKTFTAPLSIKENGEPGEVEAVFATLDVVDHDRDVTVDGAFQDGQEVVIEPWNHGWTLPAGKGYIQVVDGKAIMAGKFFLDTEVGKENYQTVKNLGDLVEWSYTFNVLESDAGDFNGEKVNFLRKLDTIGVSPVTRGAGIETRTIGIKSSVSDPDPDPGDSEDEPNPGKSRDDLLAKMDLIELSYLNLKSEVENG